MVYYFEKHQDIKFEVLDDDGNGSFDTVGWAQMTMGEVMGARAQTKMVDLQAKEGGKRGRIIVRAESL